MIMTAYVALALVICVVSAERRFKFTAKSHNGAYLSLSDLGPPRHQSTLYQHFQASIRELQPSSSSTSMVTVSSNAESITAPSANASNPLIYVTDFGADPTGKADSTAAFQKAIARALSYGSPTSNLSNGIHDCGGATIDLAGGDYLISSPLLIPQYYGNLRIVDGTLRASASFAPTSSYLLIIGDNDNNKQPCSNSQGSCNENIGVQNMMFDCKQICYGGISIIDTMGTVIGPQLFFLGFNGAGITVSGGHETMIFTAWFGEFLYSDSRKENGAASTATGIQLFGNDHYVTNTIVFSSHIGVHITHPANILQGVHTWNLAVGNNGTGILVQSAQTRLLGCYLDWNDLVLVAPIQDVSVEDGFFLGGGQYGGGVLVLRANQKESIIDGLSVFDNQFNNGGTQSNVWVDTAFGQFSSVKNMRVENNLLQNGFVQKTTRASKKLTLEQANEWKFDFSDVLIFESIDIQWVSYSIQIDDDSSFVQHTARKPVGSTVTVQTSEKVNATVYITVDQSQNS